MSDDEEKPLAHFVVHEDGSVEQLRCVDCGRELDSFACKIRHIQVNTGWAKSAND